MENIAQYYVVLNVDSAASLETVKQAYRQLAKAWHPDKYVGNPKLISQAEIEIKKINQAYSAIKSYLESKHNIPDKVSNFRSQVGVKNNTSDFYYHQGVKHAEKQNYKDALASFAQATKLDPDYIKAYQYRGFILSKLGYEYQAAEAFYQANRIKTSNHRISCKTINTVNRPISLIAISSENWLFACVYNDREIELRDISTEKIVATLKGHTDIVNSLIVSFDGTTLISGGKDKAIRFWDLETKRIVKTFSDYFDGHSKAILDLALSRDNKVLLSYGADNIINVWNTKQAKIIRTISISADLTCLEISPNCKLFGTGSLESQLNIRHIADGRVIRSIDNNASVLCMAFNPNSNILATGGDDRLIRLWDIETGNMIQTLVGHGEKLSNLAFTSNSENLISTDSNGTVKVWQLQTGKEISSVKAYSGKIQAIAIEIASHRQTLISGDDEGKIEICCCSF